jgi:hypothetical protein
MRGWVDRAVERIGPGEFRDSINREVFEALAERSGTDDPLDDLSGEAQRRVEDLLGDPEDLEHTERVFEDSLARLQERAFEERRDALARELRGAESVETERRVAEELDRLRRERRGEWNAARWPRGRAEDRTPSEESRS